MNEQDRINRSYREREFSMNIIRVFLLGVFGIGAGTGISLLAKPFFAEPQPKPADPTLSFSCFVFPLVLFSVIVIGRLLHGIVRSADEVSENKTIEKARHIAEASRPASIVARSYKTIRQLKEEEIARQKEKDEKARAEARRLEIEKRDKQKEAALQARLARANARSAEFDNWAVAKGIMSDYERQANQIALITDPQERMNALAKLRDEERLKKK